MYHILIAGAGYLGSRIALDFKSKKQKVFALTRDPEKAAAFKKEEIEPVIADLTRPETLTRIPPAHFVVLCAAPDSADEAGYRRIYLEGTRNFLESLKGKPKPFLILYISSTSVWKDRPQEWVDETIPADADSEKAKILLAAENLVLESGYPAVVLRLSGIYGPGRNRLKTLRAGSWPKSEPDAYLNMIYVEDIVRMIQVIFNKGKAGEIYTGTDDMPVLRSEFSTWLSQRTGIALRETILKTAPSGKRLKNHKLKALEYTFLYPTFREGYEAILKFEETQKEKV